jgi:hypothetical protein
LPDHGFGDFRVLGLGFYPSQLSKHRQLLLCIAASVMAVHRDSLDKLDAMSAKNISNWLSTAGEPEVPAII